MSDIVERLRGFGDDPWPDWQDVIEACKEAADEIERLRDTILSMGLDPDTIPVEGSDQ